jgi:hydrogenase maturation factor
MYHIGKILEVWSSKAAKGDDSVQATLEMWDENIITLKAEPKISKQLKTGDYVLVDYTPVMLGASAVPRQIISKVLDVKAGERTWQTYKEFHKKQKNAKSGAAAAAQMQAQESYLG